MAISEKQKELDLIKWQKSELLGRDACGTFDYCVKCNKSNENPCEKALADYSAPEKPAKTATTTKRTCAKTPAKTTTKKTTTSSTKKPTAKKSTTTKKTTKTTK